MSMVKTDSDRKGGKKTNPSSILYKDLCKLERVRNLPNVKGSKSLFVLAINTDTGTIERSIVASKDFAALDRDDFNCLSMPLALKTAAESNDNSRKAIRKFKYAISYLYHGNHPLKLCVPNVRLLSAPDFRVLIRETAEKLLINNIHNTILYHLKTIRDKATKKSPLGALHPLLETMHACNNYMLTNLEETLRVKLTTGQTRKIDVLNENGDHYPEWMRKRLSSMIGLNLDFISNSDLNQLCIGDYLFPPKLSPYLLTGECLATKKILGVDSMINALCSGKEDLFKKETLLKHVTDGDVVESLNSIDDFNTIPIDIGRFEGRLKFPNPFKKGLDYFTSAFTAKEVFPKGVRPDRESDVQIMIGFSNAMHKTYGYSDRVFGEDLTNHYNKMWSNHKGEPIQSLGLQNPLTCKQGYEAQFKTIAATHDNTLLPNAMVQAITPEVITTMRTTFSKPFYETISTSIYSHCRFFDTDKQKSIEVGSMLHACVADLKGSAEFYGFKQNSETGLVQVTIKKSGKSKSQISAYQSGGNALTKAQMALLDQIEEKDNKESVRLMASRVNVEAFRTWCISRAINVLYHDDGEYMSDASEDESDDDIYE